MLRVILVQIHLWVQIYCTCCTKIYIYKHSHRVECMLIISGSKSSRDKEGIYDQLHYLVLTKHKSSFLADRLIDHEGPIQHNPSQSPWYDSSPLNPCTYSWHRPWESQTKRLDERLCHGDPTYSLCNAIMGKIWFHRTKTILSTLY